MVLSFCFTCLFVVRLSQVRIRVNLVVCLFNAMNTYSHVCAFFFSILIRVDEHDVVV